MEIVTNSEDIVMQHVISYVGSKGKPKIYLVFTRASEKNFKKIRQSRFLSLYMFSKANNLKILAPKK